MKSKNQSRTPITLAVRLQMIEDCKTRSMEAVARLHGLSTTAVRNAFISQGLPFPRGSNYNGGTSSTFKQGCDVLEALIALNDLKGGVSRDTVAAACNVTHERIRQIEESALRKIRVKHPEIYLACESAPRYRNDASRVCTETSKRPRHDL